MRRNISEKLALSFLQKWQNLSIVAYLAALIALKKVLGYSTTKSQRICIYPKQYIHLILNKTLKLESDNARICSKHFEGERKLHRQHLPSIFPWTKSKEKRREPKRLEVGRARGCSKSKVPSVSTVMEPAIGSLRFDDNVNDNATNQWFDWLNIEK